MDKLNTLPRPMTVGEKYLAAILKELQTLNELSKPKVINIDDGVTRVQEPIRPLNRMIRRP